jgi:hypothetical protein
MMISRAVPVCLLLLPPLFAFRAYGAEAAGDKPAAPPPPALFETLAKGNGVDACVLATLKEKGIPPSERCTDEVFVRRVFLDAIGTLPTPAEARAFLADRAPDKRARLVDGLLARDEFADCWGLKWGDLLRVKSEFPSNLWPNAVQTYDRWIRETLRRDVPYDRFVRDLLTATGSNFRVPAANFYRAFQDRSPRPIAENVALLFMGVRLADAGLTEEQILGLSACFAKIGYKCTDEWKEEIVFFNPEGKLADPKTKKPVRPAPPGGKPFDLRPDQDPRIAFADWLTSKENPWFARAIANRIWFWLLGRGIVHEPDDLKPSNAPWSPALLALLEKEVLDGGFDLKRLYRLILNSTTYQLASKPNAWNAADETGFSRYRMRRLDAEVLLDAVNQITGSGEKYSSPIPEPFTFLPGDQRAITLADGSIEAPFLELFGRPPRNTSFESERSAAPSVYQAQHLLNSSHIQRKIEQSRVLLQIAAGAPRGGAAAGGGRRRPAAAGDPRPAAGAEPAPGAAADTARPLEEIYLRILSRFPTAEERQAAAAYASSSKRKPIESFYDIVWALINSKEFLLKH